MTMSAHPAACSPRLRFHPVAWAMRDERHETGCMVTALGGLALALGLTLAQATRTPAVEVEDSLRRATVRAGFDAALRPEGWVRDRARLLHRPKAEVRALFLHETATLSDTEVVASVGRYVARTYDFREIEGAALTRNQILLCIVESRRLTTPLHDLIRPRSPVGSSRF
ncbi:hypothetical protein [Jannaschia rubra]|uniref:Uncharacterized protein n=1 Tax=Jannaschia rubra TaxID=282197 RepID=A0A0M6XPG5_9RHOB|nr:hypothetical protein [Jannaschia rubra]CTQ32081.1 hypothetical protein JAN5088_00843 [Jannaschia rubra]SFG38011.1 hypothetical protein SAMN04488517_104151 [Jannaschia rubra]